MIEGEEEVGSESLWDYVQQNKAKLKADALVVSDTSMLAPGVPSITYGLRGLNYYEIEITGPAQDLHSGIFGGAVPNPLTILTSYSPNCTTRISAWLCRDFTTTWRRSRAPSARRSTRCPSRQGVSQDGGRAGAVRRKRILDRGAAVVPADAGAERHLGRLHGRRREDGDSVEGAREIFHAPGAEPGCRRRSRRLVERQIRKLLPKTVTCKFEVLSTGKPWVAPYTHPFFEVAHAALEKGFGKRAVFIREGGSIPFVTQMYDTFKVPCMLAGIRLAGRKRARARRTHRARKLFRRDQGRGQFLSGDWGGCRIALRAAEAGPRLRSFGTQGKRDDRDGVGGVIAVAAFGT